MQNWIIFQYWVNTGTTISSFKGGEQCARIHEIKHQFVNTFEWSLNHCEICFLLEIMEKSHLWAFHAFWNCLFLDTWSVNVPVSEALWVRLALHGINVSVILPYVLRVWGSWFIFERRTRVWNHCYHYCKKSGLTAQCCSEATNQNLLSKQINQNLSVNNMWMHILRKLIILM